MCLYLCVNSRISIVCCFFFQAEDGIRDLVRSRGLGDVYKRQIKMWHEMRSVGNHRDFFGCSAVVFDEDACRGISLSLIHI